MHAPLVVGSVVKRFGDLAAVDGLSFEVRRGEIFGFLGPNGAGKTTTLRMILGITHPDRGSVRFEGREQLDRTRVGYLPEERGLYEDATLLDTLEYLGTLRGLTVADARRAGKAWLERLGFGGQLKAKLNTLSKGNQQKVQFAGAVLHEPALAVLDEPFAGLDPLNQELFIELIREQRDRGAAVLLSAHHLDLVERLCDRFLLIARGRELLAGTLAEVRRAAGGAAEVLSLELLPRDGLAPPELGARLAARLSGATATTEPLADGAARVDVRMPEGSDVSPLLVEATALAHVRRVTMRTLRLHEIYVNAVATAGGTAPGRGEAADAQA
jgi:ABC-2 type transport system ATP-binding protein